MIDTYELFNVIMHDDRSCTLKYKLSTGEHASESVYLERRLNITETANFMRRLTEISSKYNVGD